MNLISRNFLYIILYIIFEVACGFYKSASYGEPCTTQCGIFGNLKCVNNTCQCASYHTLVYSKNAKITCAARYEILHKLRNDYCKSNETCPFNQYCSEKGKCSCGHETNVIVEGTCVALNLLHPMSNESCLVSYSANICDYKKMSHCRNKKCICFEKYFYNFTSEACEKISESPLYRNKPYKARPEEYCLESSNCIDGLRCLKNFTCSCPSSCVYLKDKGVCDCGKVTYEVDSAPIWFGVILSVASTILWGVLIRKTYKKKKSVIHSDVPFTPTYRPSETANNATTNVSFPASYGFNESGKPDLPPSYSEVTRDISAPYPTAPPNPDVQNSFGNPPPTFQSAQSDHPYPLTINGMKI